MTIRNRMLKLRKVSVSTSAGSDPDGIDLDDCTEVYGDWPEIDTPCDSEFNPGDQCVFNALAAEHDRCIYCEKRTG